MKITSKLSEIVLTFEEIKGGELFKCLGKIYIKTRLYDSSFLGYLSVNIEDGSVAYFASNTCVIPVSSEVIISDYLEI